MLRIKYFELFKGGQPYLVIVGDTASFRKAHLFLKGKTQASLSDPAMTSSADISSLSKGALTLNQIECQELAQKFETLSRATKPCHDYADIEALQEAEILIAYGEYDRLF